MADQQGKPKVVSPTDKANIPNDQLLPSWMDDTSNQSEPNAPIMGWDPSAVLAGPPGDDYNYSSHFLPSLGDNAAEEKCPYCNMQPCAKDVFMPMWVVEATGMVEGNHYDPHNPGNLDSSFSFSLSSGYYGKYSLSGGSSPSDDIWQPAYPHDLRSTDTRECESRRLRSFWQKKRKMKNLDYFDITMAEPFASGDGSATTLSSGLESSSDSVFVPKSAVTHQTMSLCFTTIRTKC